jgi:SAM-dependent methyltransferase
MKFELLIGCGSSRVKKLWMGNDPEWHNLTTLDNNPDHKPDVVWDLMEFPYPFGSDTFDEIHAYEVLEHLGQQGDAWIFFKQFSELHRILKPNGQIIATVPSRHSAWAWGDPSHTRIIQPETLIFLNQPAYTAQVGKTAMSDFRNIYKADFDITSSKEDPNTFTFVLTAIKPSRYKERTDSLV